MIGTSGQVAQADALDEAVRQARAEYIPLQVEIVRRASGRPAPAGQGMAAPSTTAAAAEVREFLARLRRTRPAAAAPVVG